MAYICAGLNGASIAEEAGGKKTATFARVTLVACGGFAYFSALRVRPLILGIKAIGLQGYKSSDIKEGVRVYAVRIPRAYTLFNLFQTALGHCVRRRVKAAQG